MANSPDQQPPEPDEDARDYDKVKLQLRLVAEALRLKFCNTRRGQEESISEFAYKSMSLLEEWLKGTITYKDKQCMLELFALEHFMSLFWTICACGFRTSQTLRRCKWQLAWLTSSPVEWKVQKNCGGSHQERSKSFRKE